jgi:hypothetical protein
VTVAEVLRSISKYKRDFNRAFECIAEDLPRVYAEVGELISGLAAMGARGDEAGFVLLDERTLALNALVERCRAGGQQAQEQARVTASAAEEQLRSVLDGMRIARKLAMTRRRVSLNASIAAEHRGSEGAAYNVLTHALVKLADAEAETSRRVEVLATRLQEHQSGLSELDPSMGHGVGIENGVQTAVDGLRDTMQHAQSSMARHLASAEELAARIGVLMIGIQRQDILRQGIEHVELLLQQCAERTDSLVPLVRGRIESAGDFQGMGRDLVLLERAAEVSATLWKRLSAEVQELLGETKGNLRQLLEIGHELGEAGGGTASTERVQNAVGALDEALEEGFGALQSIAKTSRAQVDLLNQAATVGHELQVLFEEFAEHRTQAESVHMLMKLETARMRGLDGGTAVADMMKEIAQQYSSLLDGSSGLMSRTRQMTVLLSRAAERIHVNAEHLGAEIVQASEEIHGHSSEAQRIAGRFEAGCAQANDAQRAASRAASRLIAALEKLSVRDGSVSVQSAVVRSLEVATKARAVLCGQGQEIDESLGKHEWQDLVDKFTIASHKETAHQRDGARPDEADSGGELTLF